MHFMNLNMLSDFMHVLNIKRKHPTKNDYFPMHTIRTIIYLLHGQKLNHRNYSAYKINMINFVQATGHDVHTYAKYGDL
jgi:hypothetical protein